MPTTTPKGIPKPVLTDAPNGPVQIGALADWLDAVLTGLTGQLLRANLATASDVEWAWPAARVVASTASIVSPSVGDIAWQTGAPTGLYVYGGGGAGWVRITPSLDGFARGYLAGAAGGGLPGTSDATVCTAGPVTLAAGRRYRVAAYARVRASEAGKYITMAGQIVRSGTGPLVTLPTSKLLVAPPTYPDTQDDSLFGDVSLTGNGAPASFDLRVYKVAGDATGVQVTSAWIEVYDVGVG